MASTFEDMKRDIESGWDEVLWSESYGWGDFAAVAACTYFGCLQAYMGQRLNDLIAKVGRDFLEQVIRNKGQVLTGPGDLQVQAGDAYWRVYHEIFGERVTTERYVRLYVRYRRRTSDPVEPSNSGRTISLQNAAATQWEGWYLDIDGGTGAVILWEHLGSGGYWRLHDFGDGTVALQVTADVPWKNWFLDIDGNTGDVILWERLASGGYWRLTEWAITWRRCK